MGGLNACSCGNQEGMYCVMIPRARGRSICVYILCGSYRFIWNKIWQLFETLFWVPNCAHFRAENTENPGTNYRILVRVDCHTRKKHRFYFAHRNIHLLKDPHLWTRNLFRTFTRCDIFIWIFLFYLYRIATTCMYTHILIPLTSIPPSLKIKRHH